MKSYIKLAGWAGMLLTLLGTWDVVAIENNGMPIYTNTGSNIKRATSTGIKKATPNYQLMASSHTMTDCNIVPESERDQTVTISLDYGEERCYTDISGNTYSCEAAHATVTYGDPYTVDYDVVEKYHCYVGTIGWALTQINCDLDVNFSSMTSIEATSSTDTTTGSEAQAEIDPESDEGTWTLTVCPTE